MIGKNEYIAVMIKLHNFFEKCRDFSLWTSVDFILNQSMSRYHQWREEMYTVKKQACGMSPNRVGLKDKHVFVKTTGLIMAIL